MIVVPRVVGLVAVPAAVAINDIRHLGDSDATLLCLAQRGDVEDAAVSPSMSEDGPPLLTSDAGRHTVVTAPA
jgi:hypothetical protein